MANREELAKKNHEFAAVVQAQPQVLGSTNHPKVAREARDVLFDHVERIVERVDQIHRIDDRVPEESIVC